jgi:hypothetical protein
MCAGSSLGSGSGTGLARTIRGRMTMAKMAFMVIVVNWLEIGVLDEVQTESLQKVQKVQIEWERENEARTGLL